MGAWRNTCTFQHGKKRQRSHYGNLTTGTAFSQIIAPDITSPSGDKPKAYLNIVFFIACPHSGAYREKIYICFGREYIAKGAASSASVSVRNAPGRVRSALTQRPGAVSHAPEFRTVTQIFIYKKCTTPPALRLGSWHTNQFTMSDKGITCSMELSYQRKSHTSIGEIYFWTATIHKWLHLLGSDANKQLILDYLKKLSSEELISVYGFVIMPNHIHLLWQQNKLNGKETPKGSLLKYTGHEFLKKLKEEGHSYLYEVNAANKKHEIWQRDSLGVEIYTSKVARQKLEYIHNNPVSGKWQLATEYLSYPYSSAKFYETGVDEFGFLENIFSVFYGD